AGAGFDHRRGPVRRVQDHHAASGQSLRLHVEAFAEHAPAVALPASALWLLPWEKSRRTVEERAVRSRPADIQFAAAPVATGRTRHGCTGDGYADRGI